MSRTTVIIVVAAIALGLYFLVDNIKNAYKLIPIEESPTMQVAAFSDWKVYNSDINGFQVSMPLVPQHATQSVAIPKTNKKRKYEMYASEMPDKSVYMVSVITYPKEVPITAADDVLDATIKEMLATNPNNELKKTEHSQFLNHDAVDFMINNSEFEIHGKVFQVDQSVYLLTYIARDDNFKLEDYQHFVDSFKLKERPKAV